MHAGVVLGLSCRLQSNAAASVSRGQQCNRLNGSVDHRCYSRVPPLKVVHLLLTLHVPCAALLVAIGLYHEGLPLCMQATSDQEGTAQESRADKEEELLPIEEELVHAQAVPQMFCSRHECALL